MSYRTVAVVMVTVLGAFAVVVSVLAMTDALTADYARLVEEPKSIDSASTWLAALPLGIHSLIFIAALFLTRSALAVTWIVLLAAACEFPQAHWLLIEGHPSHRDSVGFVYFLAVLKVAVAMVGILLSFLVLSLLRRKDTQPAVPADRGEGRRAR